MWVSVICGEAEREGDVVIEVRDDGPGIPPEQVEAVVRRFDRGAASPAVPGSGLGLSVVAAIAHLHQYTLELAASRPVAGEWGRGPVWPGRAASCAGLRWQGLMAPVDREPARRIHGKARPCEIHFIGAVRHGRS
jgi:signal transduction histidine kinase